MLDEYTLEEYRLDSPVLDRSGSNISLGHTVCLTIVDCVKLGHSAT